MVAGNCDGGRSAEVAEAANAGRQAEVTGACRNGMPATLAKASNKKRQLRWQDL